MLFQPLIDGIHLRYGVCLGSLPALVPPLDLAFDEPDGMSQIAQSNRLIVNRVQFSQRVNQRQAHQARRVSHAGEGIWYPATDDNAFSALHHKEISAQNFFVLTMKIGVWRVGKRLI